MREETRKWLAEQVDATERQMAEHVDKAIEADTDTGLRAAAVLGAYDSLLQGLIHHVRYALDPDANPVRPFPGSQVARLYEIEPAEEPQG